MHFPSPSLLSRRIIWFCRTYYKSKEITLVYRTVNILGIEKDNYRDHFPFPADRFTESKRQPTSSWNRGASFTLIGRVGVREVKARKTKVIAQSQMEQN